MFRNILIIAILTGIALPLVLASPAAAQVTIPNPIKCGTISCVLVGVIRVFLGLLAIFATFVFIYGGFLMITSGGNAETIRKAKETLFWATIGIIVVLGSWIFIRFVLQTVTTVSS